MISFLWIWIIRISWINSFFFFLFFWDKKAYQRNLSIETALITEICPGILKLLRCPWRLKVIVQQGLTCTELSFSWQISQGLCFQEIYFRFHQEGRGSKIDLHLKTQSIATQLFWWLFSHYSDEVQPKLKGKQGDDSCGRCYSYFFAYRECTISSPYKCTSEENWWALPGGPQLFFPVSTWLRNCNHQSFLSTSVFSSPFVEFSGLCCLVISCLFILSPLPRDITPLIIKRNHALLSQLASQTLREPSSTSSNISKWKNMAPLFCLFVFSVI